MSKPSFEPGAPVPADVIPLSVPHLGGREAEYLNDCLRGGFVSSVGPYVDRFESDVAKYVGVARAVATTSGTAALHLALLVAGVQANDEVLVSDVTFVAPANAVRYVNAWPVFIGVEPDFWQIDPNSVHRFLSNCERRDGALFNRRTGRRVSALIAVHILGHPAELNALSKICREFGIALIEDCAEALGAKYHGQSVGTFGDAATFSFNGNKIVTCGGGGMLIARKGEWLDRAKYLSTQAKDDPLEYIHHSIGFNYRLTSLQAAFGCAQMERLDEFIGRRRVIAGRYTEAFAKVAGITMQREAPGVRSVCWLSTVRVDPAQCGLGSRELMRELGARGIQTRPLWQPMHLSPAFADCESYQCEFSRTLWNEALSLPSSSTMTEGEQERVISSIQELIGRGR